MILRNPSYNSVARRLPPVLALVLIVTVLGTGCTVSTTAATGTTAERDASATPAAETGAEPTPEASPTAAPTAVPTAAPTAVPTSAPTAVPTTPPAPADTTPVPPAELTFDQVRFDDLELVSSKDDLIDLLGEPVLLSEFEWGGGLIGYRLDYGDLEFEIHYDVNAVTVRRPNFCTEAEVCVGSPFTAVEQAYGLGQISTEGLEPDQTRRVEYLIVGGGYCTAAFTFASDTSGVESVQEISTYCLPD